MPSGGASPEFDDEFRFVTNTEPRMEHWREAVADFYNSKGFKAVYRPVLTYFLTRYLSDTQHPFDPQEFMMKDHCPPDFYEHRGLTSRDARVDNNRVHAFLNFYRSQRLFRHAPKDSVITTNKYRNPVLMRAVDTGQVVISEYRDAQFFHITDIDPSLEEWRVVAASWPKAKTLKYARLAIDAFLLDYIGEFDLERNPQAFLRLTQEPPNFWEHICPDGAFKQATLQRNNAVHHFLAWTATEYYGIPDAYGVKHAPADLLNPVPHRNFTTGKPNYQRPDNNAHWANNADKEYRYLLDLDAASQVPKPLYFRSSS